MNNLEIIIKYIKFKAENDDFKSINNCNLIEELELLNLYIKKNLFIKAYKLNELLIEKYKHIFQFNEIKKELLTFVDLRHEADYTGPKFIF